jgi:hypothetical protein
MKKLTTILNLIFLTILFACHDSTNDSVAKFKDTISNKASFNEKQKKRIQKDNTKLDTLFKSATDDAFVLGDTSGCNLNVQYFAIRFQPLIRFNDFKAELSSDGRKAEINYSSNSTARKYRSRISEGYNSKGVNFAGHYCMIYWGCGSPCQASALVDLNTGIVYDGPAAALGYEFRKDSRMLIINPVNENGTDVFHPKPGYYLDCPYCKPEIHIWNEKVKKFEKR